MSALGPYWRITLKNATGATGSATASTIKGKRWKPDANGGVDWDDTEQSFVSVSSLGSGSYSNGTSFSNDAAGEHYWGVTLAFHIVNGTSAGNWEVWLQHSTDGGTTWPTNGQGELVHVVYAGASATVDDSITI